MTTGIITPRLNINGSSADDLIAPRRKAFDMIEDLLDALRATTPSGRDYPGDNDQFMADRAIYFGRRSALRELQTALLDECIAIRKQNGEY